MNGSNKRLMALAFAAAVMGCGSAFAGLTWTQTATEVLKSEMAKDAPSPTIVTQEGTWSFVSYGGTLTAVKDWTGPGGNKPACDALKNPNNTRPYFAVNTKEAATGPDGGTFDEDVICFHPYFARLTMAVRFQPSACGTYGLNLYGEKIANGGNGVAWTVKLNGEAISETMTITTAGSGTIEKQGLTLTPEDVVEVFIDSLDNVESDGSKMKFAISRTGDYAAETWSTTLAKDFAYAYTRTAKSSTCASTRRGTWSFGTLESQGVSGPGIFTPFPATVTEKSEFDGGVGFGNSGDGYPFALYNAGSAEKKWKEVNVAPGEMMVHPADANHCAFKYTAEDAGLYSVRAKVVDMETYFSAEDTAGVNFNVFRGGTLFKTVHVDRKFGKPSEEVVIEGLALNGGDELVFSVDANGARGGDATKLEIQLEKTAPAKVFDFTSAYRANMNSEAPSSAGFVGTDGGKWSVGSWALANGIPAFGQFAAFDLRKVESGFENMIGWCKTDYNYSYVDVNSAGEWSSSKDCSGVFANEVAVHTHTSAASGIRFVAQEDGVYVLSGLVENRAAGGDGVGLHVLVGDAVRPICTSVGDKESVTLSYDDVWLDKGETLDLVFSAGATYTYDGRVANIAVAKAGEQGAEMTRINVDIGNGSAYGGKGRIGKKGDTWTRMACGTGVAKRERLVTTRKSMYTTVSLEIGASVSGAGEVKDAPNALLADGAASSGTTDVRSFTLSGLKPGAAHALYLYASGVAPARFTVGSVTRVVDEGCFTPNPECVKIVASADANGIISGSFCSSVDDETAVFAGLQIESDEFQNAGPLGLTLLFR